MSFHAKQSDKGRETEIVLYARIHNFDNLKLAQKKESHEQWTVVAPYGKVRVRKTTLPELAPTFEVTVKTRDSKMGISDGDEDNLPCAEGFFESFKAIASEGMIKDRYEFKAASVSMKTDAGEEDLNANDDVVFEVDLFKNKDGSYCEYVKIDIEVHRLMERLAQKGIDTKDSDFDISVRQLPLKLTDVVRGDDKSETTRAFIRDLYSKYFITKRVPGGDEAPVSEPAQPRENIQSPSNEVVAEDKK